jgi:hypothetical protein
MPARLTAAPAPFVAHCRGGGATVTTTREGCTEERGLEEGGLTSSIFFLSSRPSRETDSRQFRIRTIFGFRSQISCRLSNRRLRAATYLLRCAGGPAR